MSSSYSKPLNSKFLNARDAMKKGSQLMEALSKLNTEQLDDNVYLIIGKNKGTFPYSNSLLIVDEEVVLLDSGIGDEQLQVLKDEVKILINTHYHIDHILGNHLFQKLWVVEEEAGVTSSFENYKRFAGILGTSIENDWLRWFHQHFNFQASSYTRTFKSNEFFKFGETQWEAVHTPGHSPGHCCFYEPNKRLMFSSDIDLTSFGPWYGNPNANLTDFIESIKKLSDFDMDVIATSHTMPLKNNINQALNDYLDKIFEREERVLEILEKEKTVEELETYNIMYKKEQKRYKAFAWFEQNMIKKHIDRLIKLGKVERNGERYKAL
jgi:glyoxylase-like metal-dependent hydrolase (beta-lactamase superfamily II)